MPIAVRRREIVKLLGSAALAWPLAARAQAQQAGRMRRIKIPESFLLRADEVIE